jgi:hypothetical protein
MTNLKDHPLHFMPSAAQKGAKYLYRAPVKTTACDGESCTVELPASKDPGTLKISCEDCPAWAVVSVQASVHDPRSFTMPCGRIRMHAEDVETLP